MGSNRLTRNIGNIAGQTDVEGNMKIAIIRKNLEPWDFYNVEIPQNHMKLALLQETSNVSNSY